MTPPAATGPDRRSQQQQQRARRSIVLYVEQHYDAGAAAKLLMLNKRTLLNLVRDGEFPRASKPFPNKILIPAGDLDAYVARHRIVKLPASAEQQEEDRG